MIIDLTISNFRSIKSEQTFSLYAENIGTHLLSNIAFTDKKDIGILRSAGVYGANASGKSNLLRAFRAIDYIVSASGDLKEGDEISCYEPYLLSEKTKSAPVRFEIEFYLPHSGRYRYVVAFTRHEVVEESLTFYSSAKPGILFSRNEKDDWRSIKFGSLYKGGKKRHPFFKNNAYVSVAGNKADTPEIVRDVYNYFRREVFYISSDSGIKHVGLEYTDQLLRQISAFLACGDIGINGIKSEETESTQDFNFPKDMPKRLQKAIIKSDKVKFLFSHKSESGGNEFFELYQESAGTRKLFELAPLLIDALEDGGILIIDELENSMHPFMAELIIKLFNDEEVNRNGAQLIFSTHSINLMRSDCLRRDQIWFTDKIENETTVFSLEDFDKSEVKPRSPFGRWYAEGRFGGIPKVDYLGIANIFKESRKANAKESAA